jgi:hypothetical protein
MSSHTPGGCLQTWQYREATQYSSNPTKLISAVARHEQVIGELVAFNQHIHGKMEGLNHRLIGIEAHHPGCGLSDAGNHYIEPALTVRSTFGFRGMIDGRRSRSPSAERDEFRAREDKTTSTREGGTRKGRGRAGLQIQVPGELWTSGPVLGLPTPLTSTMVCLSPRCGQLVLNRSNAVRNSL